MSDDDEALRINTLHRFRKHSPRLLLEEYSHCEVPAGCGGVVLRWLDPNTGTPAIVRVFAEAKLRTWVNGVESESGRVDLPAGTNVLALACERSDRPDRSRIASAFSRMLGRNHSAWVLISIVRALGSDANTTVVLLASGQGPATWRVTDQQPPPTWMLPEFDDRDWATPARAARVSEEPDNWHISQMLGHGAVPLQLPSEQAWLRVRFDVPPLQARERGGREP